MKSVYHKIYQIEWARLRKSGLFKSLLMILLLFFVAAFYTGVRQHQFRKNTIDYIVKKEKEKHQEFKNTVAELERRNEEFQGNGHRDPSNPMGVANSTGNRTFYLPPTEMSFINIGESDVRPNYYKLGLYKPTTLYHKSEIENASVLYNGHFDVAFVLVFVLPLLVIALTYNLASYDKEHGTLGILLSGAVDFKEIISVRFIFRGALLYVLTLIVLTVGVVLTGNFSVFAKSDFWFLLFIVGVYLSFWLALSYWINSYQKSSSFNASVLAALWLVLVILLPGILKETSARVHPMPSKIELIAKRREVTDSIRNQSNEVLNQFMEDHPDLVPKNFQTNKVNNTVTRYTVATAVNETMKPMEDAFTVQLEKQEEMIENYRFLSPTVMMQKMVEHLSGNGRERYKEFESQLDKFREEYRVFFVKRIFAEAKFKSEEYDLIPKASYQEKEVGTFHFIINILLMLGFSVALVIPARIKLNKLKTN